MLAVAAAKQGATLAMAEQAQALLRAAPRVLAAAVVVAAAVLLLRSQPEAERSKMFMDMQAVLVVAQACSV